MVKMVEPLNRCRFFRFNDSAIHDLMAYLKSPGFTPSMSSNTWFSPAMPQMNL
jgi:hypothetical protein